ncbi:hypothetical protein SAMN05660199_00170 [Klenkia soli]|uniref:GAF domain-containing protein n=1 Tax=Klenkia soli TaxID=1052260 RepID=A0A1H0C0L3_9ACTN|nr:hypothetical protein [Klenkia soli]SDN51375.1 hypothetical protein SAMN05660199_00170 [Klenkia soli]
MSVGSKTVIAVRSTAAVVAAVGVVGTSAQQAGVWDDPPVGLLWTCIVSPAAVAIGEQIRGIVKERKSGSREERQQAVDLALTQAVLRIHDATGFDKYDIGVSVWRVRSPRLRWLTGGHGSLQRVGRRRFNPRPTPSDITWTRGKGVIGLCWEGQDELHKDLRPACKKYPNGACTETRWQSVSPDLRMGMSLEEFRMMIGKYGEVLAMPIKSAKGTFLGCVAVDVPIEACNPDDVAKLGTTAVRNIAAATADVMQEVFGDA